MNANCATQATATFVPRMDFCRVASAYAHLLCVQWRTMPQARFSAGCSRRGSRYPPGAHTGAVALRVDCAVVLGLGSAPRNSLCSLRSRRSDNRGENVDAVRCAHRPQPCAPRRHRDRPRRVRTPASERIWTWGQQGVRVRTSRKSLAWYSAQTETTLQQRCARVGSGAPVQRRGAQLSRLRAQRAASTCSSRLSERRERSERSEFRDAAVKARTAGQSTRSATAAVKRHSTPGRSFATSTHAHKTAKTRI
jgi:hypothetical protein